MSVALTTRNIFPAEAEIPEHFQFEEILDQKEYLSDGHLVSWEGPQQYVFSPLLIQGCDGLQRKLIGKYPLMDKKRALNVLNAAVKAYDYGRGEWARMPFEERIQHMNIFLERLRSKREEIVKFLVWEIGKPYSDSLKEFDRTIQNISDTIAVLRNILAEDASLQHGDKIISRLQRTPLGVVLCMGPYNFPLNESFATVIPALLMGNSVIFKPPKHGVLLHYPVLKLFRECFPSGVINTIYGEGEEVVKPILETGMIHVLAFIGTSKVANILRSYHPQPNRLVNVLGLEAKNPAIVLPDADVDYAVSQCLAGALSFSGQRCTALKILFVHKSIVHDFLKKLSNQIDTLKVGMPWESDVVITPLPEDHRTGYLKALVNDAVMKGADIINDKGGRMEKTVFYPTLLYPVNNTMRIFHEEQFGPVVPVCSFDSISEPVEYLIHSKYGQQASIFGQDPQTMKELTSVLVNQVARVNINTYCQRGPDNLPFTGRKDSAKATLSIPDALRVFSMKSVIAAREPLDSSSRMIL